MKRSVDMLAIAGTICAVGVVIVGNSVTARVLSLASLCLVAGCYVAARRRMPNGTAALAPSDSDGQIGSRDELTGLLNRRAMSKLLSQYCRTALPFTLLYIDLDRFKVVNDTAGHLIGDSVIAELARRICRALPGGSLTSRPSGCDEFSVIVVGECRPNAISALCDRLLATVREPVVVDTQTCAITMSIGAALFPQHGASPEALFTSADLAMYAAKKAGRDTYRLFGAQEKQERGRLQMERELREAVQHRQFELLYQPQFCARAGTVKGAEALLRWNHPLRGQVSPGEFIPLLEETGLIVPVGNWVVWEAVRTLAAVRLAGENGVSLSVNVSPRQFHGSHLVETIRDALATMGVHGSQLVVEITETTLMLNLERAQSILEQLRLLQVRIAIDDFGTGYSSLSYVTKLRPDILKLDKSFVDVVATDSAARTVVEAVIALAHKLQIVVVAEGVETQAELEVLKAVDCDELQGYILGRPEPYDAVLARLSNVVI